MNSKLNWQLAVCSWSLGNDAATLKMLKEQTGVTHIHLHIRPELGKVNEEFVSEVLQQGWVISSGMVGFEQEDYSTLETIKQTGGIVPKDCWDKNKLTVISAIDILSGLGVPYLSFHFGYVEAKNTELIERVNVLADYAAAKNMILLLETGQETADELLEFIEKINHTALGINFDPANMILYGKGEPIAALNILKPYIRHIHIKDANAPAQTGQWGTEVAWGDGQAGGDKFLDALKSINYSGVLSVEREAGNTRLEDVKLAVKRVNSFLETHR